MTKSLKERTMSHEEHRVAIEQARTAFKKLIAEARGQHGRDFVRGLPQGKLLDALDANRKCGFPTDSFPTEEKTDA